MWNFPAPETCRHGGARILVTGFGAFPGAPVNPSAALLKRLGRQRARLARLGIILDTLLLPVVYDEIAPALMAHAEAFTPHAILHLGLAGRRKTVSVETRAINRAGPLHPDAARRRPAQIIAPGHEAWHRATYPAPQILAAVRAAGVSARRSIDAGDYVCNATLYNTLDRGLAPVAGFIHVPRPRRASLPRRWGAKPRPTLDDLARGVLAAILVLAPVARRRRDVAFGQVAAVVTEIP